MKLTSTFINQNIVSLTIHVIAVRKQLTPKLQFLTTPLYTYTLQKVYILLPGLIHYKKF